MNEDQYSAVCVDGPLVGETITVYERVKTKPPSFLVPAAISWNLFVADESAVMTLEYRWVDWPIGDGVETKVWSSVCPTCAGQGRLPACRDSDFCECKVGSQFVECPDCGGASVSAQFSHHPVR